MSILTSISLSLCFLLCLFMSAFLTPLYHFLPPLYITPSPTYRAYKSLVTRLKNLDKPINTVEEFDAYLPGASLPLASVSLSLLLLATMTVMRMSILTPTLSLCFLLFLFIYSSLSISHLSFCLPSLSHYTLIVIILADTLGKAKNGSLRTTIAEILLHGTSTKALLQQSNPKVDAVNALTKIWGMSVSQPNTFSIPSGNEYAAADADEYEDNDEYTNLCLSSLLPAAFYASYSSFDVFTTIP